MLEFLIGNIFARAVFLALLFVVVVLGGMTVMNALSRRAAIRENLGQLRSTTPSGAPYTLGDNKHSSWTRLADRIEKSGLSLNDSKADQLRDKMIGAGFESPAAPRLFTLTRLALVLLLPVGFILLVLSTNTEMGFMKLYLYGGVLALAGLYLPNLYISARADRRRAKITNGFPDCLDLLLVCVEAGLGLEAAFNRVGREMVHSHPLVARLLSEATLKFRAGAAREDALRAMGAASGVPEVRNFATLLIQSDKLGTSIAATLRIYAGEMREKRRLRAEEKAHRLPVLISIPLVLCMLPTMIGVLMLPGVVRTARILIPTLGGG